MTTHQKGYEAEALVKLEAVRRGWIASKPEVETRYDLVLDDGVRLHRVQVKYVDSFVGDALSLDLRKQCRNNGKTKLYTADEIDAIVMFVPKTGLFYWISPELFSGKTVLSFRLESSKNKQISGTRFLKDFEWVSSSIGRARHS